MRNREREERREPFRRSHGDQYSQIGAPVVAYEPGPRESESIQEADEIIGKPVLLVATLRRVGPSDAPQVGHQAAKIGREPRRYVAPAPPVLRPPMDQEQRGSAFLRPHLGHVKPDTIDENLAVADSVEGGLLARGQGSWPVAGGSP